MILFQSMKNNKGGRKKMNRAFTLVSKNSLDSWPYQEEETPFICIYHQDLLKSTVQ